jgi:polyhydroxyalkanoate synthesis regulator protein
MKLLAQVVQFLLINIKKNHHMFTFNPILNTQYLQEIYGDDLGIIQIMFESFLEDNIPIWKGISEKINEKSFKEVGDMAHQIKPSFSMVGLNFLHPKIQHFEQSAKTNPDKQELLSQYDSLDVEINHAKLVIKEELKRMYQIA